LLLTPEQQSGYNHVGHAMDCVRRFLPPAWKSPIKKALQKQRRFPEISNPKMEIDANHKTDE